MTFKQLQEFIKKYKISEDVVLRSDSGWECGPTEMDGVFYSLENNEIIFTQFPVDDERDSTLNGFILLK